MRLWDLIKTSFKDRKVLLIHTKLTTHLISSQHDEDTIIRGWNFFLIALLRCWHWSERRRKKPHFQALLNGFKNILCWIINFLVTTRYDVKNTKKRVLFSSRTHFSLTFLPFLPLFGNVRVRLKYIFLEKKKD